MEPLRVSFLCRATYDLLPTPANLNSWYDDKSDKCAACGERGTLQHIPSTCRVNLVSGMYTWRHNNVLKTVTKAVEQRVLQHNASNVPRATEHQIKFVKGGSKVKMNSACPRPSILSSANDWCVKADLDGKGGFPEQIALTTLRPHIIVWSDESRVVVIGELTVPWEDSMDEAQERKSTKYAELSAECRERGWNTSCFPFEVGCRGVIGFTFQKWLYTWTWLHEAWG